MDAMYFMNTQHVTGKGVSKDRKKGMKMQKNAAEERRHKPMELDERHCNDEDTQFSVDHEDEPANVAQDAALNGDAQHPEHLLRIDTEDESFIKGGTPPTTTRLEMDTRTSAD